MAWFQLFPNFLQLHSRKNSQTVDVTKTAIHYTIFPNKSFLTHFNCVTEIVCIQFVIILIINSIKSYTNDRRVTNKSDQMSTPHSSFKWIALLWPRFSTDHLKRFSTFEIWFYRFSNSLLKWDWFLCLIKRYICFGAHNQSPLTSIIFYNESNV